MVNRISVGLSLLVLSSIGSYAPGAAQERVKIAYSSADASNVIWYLALDSAVVSEITASMWSWYSSRARQ